MRKLLEARRRTKPPSKPIDRCPHDVRPLAGAFTPDLLPLRCTRCAVDVTIHHDQATTRVTSSYMLNEKVLCSFYFPVSEFGKVSSTQLWIDDSAIDTATFRRGSSNTEWFDSGNEAFSKPEAPAADGKRVPPIYAAIARNFAVGRSGRKTVVRVVLEVESSLVQDSDGVWCYALPYTCCPRPPSELSYRVQMRETIRSISSPNRSHRLHPIIRGRRADATVDIDPSKGATTEDYLFITQIELGEPIRPECADPVALLILTTAVAAMIFFALTQSLDDDF
jgi:hypothetical protein